MSLRLSYGTNGLAYHRLDDALALLADCGYDGVSLTLDHHHLDPFAADAAAQTARLARRLDELGLAVVIETGTRFLLDPRRKHEPTLVSAEGRELRLDFYGRAIAIAAELGAEAVSLWSGVPPPGTSHEVAWQRLLEGCAKVVELADNRGVVLGFEPEPGMLVQRLDEYEQLVGSLGDPPRLGLTLDLGHCLVVDEPVVDSVRQAGPRLVNVHVEDMRREAHDHLDFGEGEFDFPPALAALREIGYTGLVGVELSRHSHAADTVVPRALRFLRDAERAEAAVRVTEEQLRAELGERASEDGLAWLEDAIERVRENADDVHVLFPAVGRKVGRGPLDPEDGDDLHGWTVDDAARTLLLLALGDGAGPTLEELYRNGDAAERRAVLRSLALVEAGDSGLWLVDDAVRTNELPLIAAALGPYAFETLDDDAVAQAVLKCVFVGVPLAGLEGLDGRVTPELSRMLAGYVHERIAAGRTVPAEVWPVIDRHPPAEELDAIQAELDHPIADRREAARAALALRPSPKEA